MNISQRIQDKVLQTLEKNPGGLTFNELHERLTRYHYKNLQRKYLGKTLGQLFRNNKIQSYKLDGLKILQIKE